MNRGFRAKYVRSAVVNDGVCDCCDGTDEHASGACANDCIAAGATARAEAAERMKVIEAGIQAARTFPIKENVRLFTSAVRRAAAAVRPGDKWAPTGIVQYQLTLPRCCPTYKNVG